jgi:hypothetical protein
MHSRHRVLGSINQSIVRTQTYTFVVADGAAVAAQRLLQWRPHMHDPDFGDLATQMSGNGLLVDGSAVRMLWAVAGGHRGIFEHFAARIYALSSCAGVA